jgi:hypothetical protein
MGIFGLLLLLLAVGGVVAFDLIGGMKQDDKQNEPDLKALAKEAGTTQTTSLGLGTPWSKYKLKDPTRRLDVSFDEDTMRFGLFLTQEWDPNHVGSRRKRLTYWENGQSNNTVVKIGNFEYLFGRTTPRAKWAWGTRGEAIKDHGVSDSDEKEMGSKTNKNMSLKELEISKNRYGKITVMDFPDDHVRVTQHVEIVGGASGLMDTCLVWYTIENRGAIPQRVGLRVLLDTYIGANDGVPFTIPGEKALLRDMRKFNQKEVKDIQYVEVLEKGDDPKDTGSVVRLGLSGIKLPGIQLEDIERMVIARWPGINALWEWSPLQAMNDTNAGPPDSAVALYWDYAVMTPKEKRHMAFTYGLSALEIDAGDPSVPAQGKQVLALSVPASVLPEREFLVTVYGWNLKKGDTVKLNLPDKGLSLAPGESGEKVVDEEGKRIQLFFKVKSGKDQGEYPIDATSGATKAKPVNVRVRESSIFG